MRSRRLESLIALGLLTLMLSGCVTYHQPRYGTDGVYFDQWQAAPAQVVVVDPGLYPFWSLDFFYASRFHGAYRWGPYRSPFFAHRPWFFYDPWFHPHRPWAGSVVWAHPVVYKSPPLDQRLMLMQETRSPERPRRQLAGYAAGSEVQLRHRLAEDRAAAARRSVSADSRAGSSTDLGPAPRLSPARSTRDQHAQSQAPRHRPLQSSPPPSRSSAPVRQPAPRIQPQRPVREAEAPRPATRPAAAPGSRTETPRRANPERQERR